MSLRDPPLVSLVPHPFHYRAPCVPYGHTRVFFCLRKYHRKSRKIMDGIFRFYPRYLPLTGVGRGWAAVPHPLATCHPAQASALAIAWSPPLALHLVARLSMAAHMVCPARVLAPRPGVGTAPATHSLGSIQCGGGSTGHGHRVETPVWVSPRITPDNKIECGSRWPRDVKIYIPQGPKGAKLTEN